MVASREKLNIILMRDSGESKRIRMHRSRFRALMAFFILCPFLVAGAVAGGYYLWKENALLKRTIVDLEGENQKLEHTAQRLSNLEALLHTQYSVKNALTENLAQNIAKNPASSGQNSNSSGKSSQTNSGNAKNPAGSALQANTANTSDEDGPGHDVFPVLDTKEIIVQNVSSTLEGRNKLRTSFDLRNESGESISGEVTSVLILNTGESIRLTTRPADAGKYKISHFKSSLLVTTLDKKYDLTNAQIILEVKNSAGTDIYRNIYPIAQ